MQKTLYNYDFYSVQEKMRVVLRYPFSFLFFGFMYNKNDEEKNMDKKERYEHYHYFEGLNAWEIGCYQKDIRPIVVNDGPLGVRKPVKNDFSAQESILETVCLLSPAALAASFSQEVCYENGRLLALDCLSKKVDVLLAPGINIKRSALCGRNFEYFSEDPYLTGFLASRYIQGLEDNGAASCVKHYACNNQEYFRLTNSSEVSYRALNEIYLWAFHYVIQHAAPSLLMTSYNRVNGLYVNESDYLIQKKLRKEFGYQGLIISDWTAVVNKGKTIHTGLDVEMPISKRTMKEIDEGFHHDFFLEDIENRTEEITRTVSRLANKEKPTITYDFDEIHQKARGLAEESFVLLKNENNYLPFNKEEKVLVLGYFASHPRFVGGGSAWVNTHQNISYLQALLRENIPFDYVEAYRKNEYTLNEDELLKSIHQYQKVLVFLGQYEEDESEGWDRGSLKMHEEQKRLLSFLKEHHIPYASIVVTGSVINIDELKNNASSILIGYLAGEGMYEAIGDVIYGKVSPSGRLPETWIRSLEANPIYKDFIQSPIYYSYYDDDIFVGYRYYDQQKDDEINYHFGEGLSYAHFIYSNFKLKKEEKSFKVELTIENTSSFTAKDVIQIYVGKNDSVIYRPLKELKAIAKEEILGNIKKEITIEVFYRDLAVYDVTSDEMKIEDGKYQIYIAKNVKEILAILEIEIPGEKLQENKKIPSLIRKEEPQEPDITTPVLEVIHTEKFKKMMHEKHPDLDIDEFFKNHSWMMCEPIKNITFNGELDIDFQHLKKYYR